MQDLNNLACQDHAIAGIISGVSQGYGARIQSTQLYSLSLFLSLYPRLIILWILSLANFTVLHSSDGSIV